MPSKKHQLADKIDAALIQLQAWRRDGDILTQILIRQEIAYALEDALSYLSTGQTKRHQYTFKRCDRFLSLRDKLVFILSNGEINSIPKDHDKSGEWNEKLQEWM